MFCWVKYCNYWDLKEWQWTFEVYLWFDRAFALPQYEHVTAARAWCAAIGRRWRYARLTRRHCAVIGWTFASVHWQEGGWYMSNSLGWIDQKTTVLAWWRLLLVTVQVSWRCTLIVVADFRTDSIVICGEKREKTYNGTCQFTIWPMKRFVLFWFTSYRYLADVVVSAKISCYRCWRKM